jgi:DNA-binding transcriptional MerR regulator
MSSVNDRSHLSIGEVLSLLQADFPDVSISKIRFLESQGLLDPERTPSGYRKFYEADIERLRWILRQQRENFLPLKVIKDRLAKGEIDFTPAGEPHSPVGSAGAPTDRPRQPAPEPVAAAHQVATPAPAVVHDAPPPVEPRLSAPERGPARIVLDDSSSAVSLSIDELSKATGLTAREIGELERFGMLRSRPTGTTAYYDDEALEVARVAAAFRSHGVEARHLRMYKLSAQREVGLFEQLLLPIMRKHSSQARQEAADLAGDLASLGDALRAAMLRQQLRDLLDGT